MLKIDAIAAAPAPARVDATRGAPQAAPPAPTAEPAAPVDTVAVSAEARKALESQAADVAADQRAGEAQAGREQAQQAARLADQRKAQSAEATPPPPASVHVVA